MNKINEDPDKEQGNAGAQKNLGLIYGNGQPPRSGSTRAQDTSTLAYLINLVGFICLI
jgi:hypothetical protein